MVRLAHTIGLERAAAGRGFSLQIAQIGMRTVRVVWAGGA
jgi:hypothetical protein